jgi:dipeptide/tripeptide permease
MGFEVEERAVIPVKTKTSVMLSAAMMILGIVIIYYASKGFSGTADFQGSVGPIVPNGLMPVFALGIIIFALGVIKFRTSISSSQLLIGRASC